MYNVITRGLSFKGCVTDQVSAVRTLIFSFVAFYTVKDVDGIYMENLVLLISLLRRP